jgi:hypothetical protein
MKIAIKPTAKVAVMGMNETGKTVICRLQARAARPSVVVYDPLGQYPADVSFRPRNIGDVDEFDDLVRACYYDPPKRLIIEEAEQVLPQRGVLPPWFLQYSMPGRNLGLAWTINLRAPQLIEKSALNLADHLFIFKLEGTSVDYMRNRVGRHNRGTFDRMLRWRKEDYRFFHYHSGELTECPPLPASLVKSLEDEA